MKLSREEQDMLEGGQGPTLQKVMQSLVFYGEALGAERFVDVEWGGHFAIPFAIPGLGPRVEMLDELVEAGLKTTHPFTLDPRAPLDFENLDLTAEQEQAFLEMFRNQARYDQRMRQLGLRDEEAYTCTPYLPEVGNAPERDAILAWSESLVTVTRARLRNGIGQKQFKARPSAETETGSLLTLTRSPWPMAKKSPIGVSTAGTLESS